MTIYLLVADYDHEGDRVDGCYATEALAIDAARAVIADDRDYYPSGDEYHREQGGSLRFPGRYGKSLRVDPWEVEGAAPAALPVREWWAPEDDGLED